MLFRRQSSALRLLLLVALAALPANRAPASDCPNPQPPVIFEPDLPTVGGVRTAGYSADTDGSTTVIGDPYFRTLPTGGIAGAFAVYEKQGATWVGTAMFTPPSISSAERLGQSVAVRGDRIAATGLGGPIRIYERAAQGQPWGLAATIPLANCHAVRMDGSVIYAATNTGAPSPATIYVVSQSAPGQWSTQSIISGVRISNDNGPTGWAVQGDRMIFGFASNGLAANAQATVIYQRNPSTGAWAQEATLPARADPSFTGYGVYVALDGDTAVVGANWNPPPLGSYSGYARIFRRDPATGQWPLEAELTHPAPTAGGATPGFGMSVGIRGDLVVVGSMLDDYSGLDAGALYLFRRSAGLWSSVGSYTLNDSPAAWLGWSVKVLPDSIFAGAVGLNGTGGAAIFDACTTTGGPGATPRCLPGISGLLAFIQAFFADDPFADYNLSGMVTIQDFFDFINDWFAGCP